VFGGWWYWNAGYWYPAWGYAPYAYYPYDGPIYGYGDLTPDQIIANVQIQLQRDGYYVGAIDGVPGIADTLGAGSFSKPIMDWRSRRQWISPRSRRLG
jgi:hypothetical protein